VISGGGRYISPTFARQDVTVRAEKDSTITGVTITNANTRGTALWIESTNQRSRTIHLPIVTGTAFYHRYSYPKLRITSSRNGGNGISVARSAQERFATTCFRTLGLAWRSVAQVNLWWQKTKLSRMQTGYSSQILPVPHCT